MTSIAPKSLINTSLLWKPILLYFILPAVGLFFIGVLLNLIAAYFQARRHQKWLAKQKTLNDLIYNLRPDEFEDYIGALFKRLGYDKVDVIGGVNQADGGFDVRAERNNQTYYIQVKKYGLKHPVRVEQVRAFYGALKANHLEAKGVFITTSYFTYGFVHTAKNFAKQVGIELIDGQKLVEMIQLADQLSSVVKFGR